MRLRTLLVVAWFIQQMARLEPFVLDTRLDALRLSPFTRNGSLFLHGYSDSEFAGDREIRKSVFAFITFLCGAPISGNQKHVTVLPYQPQKLNTMLVMKQPKK
jgi:hypothetical protein